MDFLYQMSERKPESEFLRLLGRSKSQAYSHVHQPPIEGLDWLKLPKEKRVAVPPEAWADANRRHNTPRTLSAWICGDPAPGFSALDRRTGGAAYVG
jgi:hypothetical protein